MSDNGIEAHTPQPTNLEIRLNPQEYLENADTVYQNLNDAVVVPTETPGMDVIETGAESKLESLQLARVLRTLGDIIVNRESPEGTHKLAGSIAACFRSLALSSPQRIPVFFKGYKKIETEYPDGSLEMFLEETEPVILHALEHYPQQTLPGKSWTELVEEYKASRDANDQNL